MGRTTRKATSILGAKTIQAQQNLPHLRLHNMQNRGNREPGQRTHSQGKDFTPPHPKTRRPNKSLQANLPLHLFWREVNPHHHPPKPMNSRRLKPNAQGGERGRDPASRPWTRSLNQQRKSANVNLSSTELTPPQLSVLELGLTFVPTPTVSQFELFLDLQKFLRDVRRKDFLWRMIPPGHQVSQRITLKLKVNFIHPNTEIIQLKILQTCQIRIWKPS